MSAIQVDIEALKAKSAEIQELDIVLDAQTDSKKAGKRATRNKLVAEYADDEFVKNSVAKIREKFSEEELYATFFALADALDNEFSDEADQQLDTLLESGPAEPVEKLSDEDLVAMQETRKEKVKEFKALANILEMFGQDVSSVSEPKIRRGSRGPRGPRTLSKFQYQVNDTVLEPEVNSLSTVAKLSGNVKVSDLKSFITEQGVDLSNPPAEWTAQLPNGATLSANVLPEYEEDFVEDENGDETDAA